MTKTMKLYPGTHRIWFKTVAISIVMLMVLHDVSSAAGLRPGQDATQTLNAPSSFALTTAAFRDGAAFLYLDKLIKEALTLFGDKISPDGIKDLLAKQLSRTNVSGFQLEKIYREGNTLYLPYVDEDSGERGEIPYPLPGTASSETPAGAEEIETIEKGEDSQPRAGGKMEVYRVEVPKAALYEITGVLAKSGMEIRGLTPHKTRVVKTVIKELLLNIEGHSGGKGGCTISVEREQSASNRIIGIKIVAEDNGRGLPRDLNAVVRRSLRREKHKRGGCGLKRITFDPDGVIVESKGKKWERVSAEEDVRPWYKQTGASDVIQGTRITVEFRINQPELLPKKSASAELAPIFKNMKGTWTGMQYAVFKEQYEDVLERFSGMDPINEYHNFRHTMQVISVVAQGLSRMREQGMPINTQSAFKTLLAALYHDIAYSEKNTRTHDHVGKSVNQAEKILQGLSEKEPVLDLTPEDISDILVMIAHTSITPLPFESQTRVKELREKGIAPSNPALIRMKNLLMAADLTGAAIRPEHFSELIPLYREYAASGKSDMFGSALQLMVVTRAFHEDFAIGTVLENNMLPGEDAASFLEALFTPEQMDRFNEHMKTNDIIKAIYDGLKEGKAIDETEENNLIEQLKRRKDLFVGPNMPRKERRDDFNNTVFLLRMMNRMVKGESFTEYMAQRLRLLRKDPAFECDASIVLLHVLTQNAENFTEKQAKTCVQKLKTMFARIEELTGRKKTNGERSYGFDRFYDPTFTVKSTAKTPPGALLPNIALKSYSEMAESYIEEAKAATDDWLKFHKLRVARAIFILKEGLIGTLSGRREILAQAYMENRREEIDRQVETIKTSFSEKQSARIEIIEALNRTKEQYRNSLKRSLKDYGLSESDASETVSDYSFIITRFGFPDVLGEEHDTQFDFISGDFKNIINKKKEKNDRSFTVFAAGVGSIPLEIERILQTFYNALTHIGEDPSAWAVRVYAIDATEEYIPVTKDAIDGHLFTETLKVAGVSPYKNPNLKIFPVHLNILDSEGMQALLEHSGERPDYFFIRRLLYVTTQHELGKSNPHLGKTNTLKKYITLSNIFASAKPGTRIVFEASKNILSGEKPGMSDFNPAPKGAEVLKRGMGILKVTNPKAFPRKVEDFIKNLDAENKPSKPMPPGSPYAMYELLLKKTAPVTAREVAEETGLSEYTAKFDLRALFQIGMAKRTRNAMGEMQYEAVFFEEALLKKVMPILKEMGASPDRKKKQIAKESLKKLGIEEPEKTIITEKTPEKTIITKHEILEKFKKEHIFWDTVPISARCYLVELLAATLEMQPGALELKHFRKELPVFGDKSLITLIAVYALKNRFRGKNRGKRAVKALKKDVGIEDFLPPPEEEAKFTRENWAETREILKKHVDEKKLSFDEEYVIDLLDDTLMKAISKFKGKPAVNINFSKEIKRAIQVAEKQSDEENASRVQFSDNPETYKAALLIENEAEVRIGLEEKENALREILPPSPTKEKNIRIFMEHCYKSGVSFEDIGRLYGLADRQDAHQICKRIINNIMKSNNPKIKAAFSGVFSRMAKAREAEMPRVEGPKRDEAQGLIDAVFCREFETRNNPQKERILVVLDIGWIKGYEKGSPQYNFLNPVFTAMRKFCASRGISFKTAGGENLMEIMTAEKTRLGAGTKTIVLSGMNEVLSDKFKSLRDDADTFLVGIDNSELTAERDMRIMEIMKLALKQVFALARGNENPDIEIKPQEGFSNVFIFIPKPGPLIEECTEIYQLHRRVLHTAA